MSSSAEARIHVVTIAGPLRLGENVKAVLARVARATGLGERRIRGIWNGEARAIRAEEMDRLREAARDAKAREEARRAYRALTSGIAACDAALGLPRADDRGSAPDGLVEEPRALDRAVDRGA